MPRNLSNQTCSEKAKELVECLAMWGIGRADAYAITREMKFLLQSMNDKEYTAASPTANSGLTADQILETGLQKVREFNFDENEKKH